VQRNPVKSWDHCGRKRVSARRLVLRSARCSPASRRIKHLAPTPRSVLGSPPFLPDFFETGLLEIIRGHDDPKFDTGVESKEPGFS